MLRYYVENIGYNLVLPAAIGAAALILVGLLRKIRLEALGEALAGFAPGIAVLAALYGFGWHDYYRYPPSQPNYWLGYLGVLAGCGYLLCVLLPSLTWLGWIVPLEVGLVTAALTVMFIAPGISEAHWLKDKTLWVLILPQAIFLNWWSLLALARRSDGAAPLLPMLAWGFAVATLVGFFGSARYAQIAAMPVAALGGAGLLAISKRFRADWQHLIPGAVLVLTGVVVQAYFSSRSDVATWSPHDPPRLSYLLALAAPLSVWLLELPGINQLAPWLRRVLQAVLVGAVGAAALHIAHEWPELMPASPGDDDWP